jgi:EpsI family protein
MSGSFTLRISAAIGILAACFAVVYVTSVHGIPQMGKPDWHLKGMPTQLGDWTWDGVKKELDPRMFNAIGALEVENRVYRNPSGEDIVLHSALFDDAEKGMEHSPINCYRESGWERISTETVPLGNGPDHSAEICIILWAKDHEQCMTGHWYQVGEDQVFDRSMGLMGLRWKRIFQNEWPPMVKVLLQTSVTDPARDSASLRDIGLQIYRWLAKKRNKSS